MAEEDRDRELPQRVRGAAAAGPPPAAPASSPLLSEELRQRMQAAVTAERTGTAARERDGTPGGGANGVEGKQRRAVTAEPERPVPSGPPVRPERTANAGPIAEDEITEWLGAAKLPSAAEPPPAAGLAAGRGRPGVRLAVLVAIVVLVSGALGAAAARYFAGPPGSGPASAQAARQEAARNQAASWVARQVSRDAVVSCDRVMCAALTAHGFPSRNLLVLGPTSNYPVSSAVVVETAAVQELFGSSLATAWAPALLASFGSGSAAVAVRVIAPHGAAAYRIKLNADLANRKNAGAGLLNDQQITVPVLASAQLSGGQVDSRLLLALADLAARHPIRIVQFGNDGPRASADIPLRFVDLAENVPAADLARAAYVRSVRAYLSSVNASFRPAAMTTVLLANGQAVLRVEVAAPSPLGVLGPQGSP